MDNSSSRSANIGNSTNSNMDAARISDINGSVTNSVSTAGATDVLDAPGGPIGFEECFFIMHLS